MKLAILNEDLNTGNIIANHRKSITFWQMGNAYSTVYQIK